MLSVPNRSEASSVGGPTNRQKGFAIVTRSSASVTLHLAPSGRGSDLVQASPHWARRSGPMALGVEQARPPPIGARPSFERPPGAPRGLLMAALKGASTGLGWGFVLMTSFLALRASVCIFLWCLFNYFAR